MTGQVLSLTQSADHVAVLGENILIEGDPFTVLSIKPKREAGVFLDYNRNVQYNLVELVVERFDGYPA